MSQLSASSMTWLSRQMSEGRGIGAFDNYGDMLYTEGLQDLEKREQQVTILKARSLESRTSIAYKP